MSTCIRKECTLATLGTARRCRWHLEAEAAPDARAAIAMQHRQQWDGVHVRGSGSCAGCGRTPPKWYMSGARCKSCAILDRRRRTYGLSDEDQHALAEASGGKCMVCNRAQKYKSLAVDHDHTHGDKPCRDCVRGLLCETCNHTIIGSSFESASWLLCAAIYLLRPPAKGILGLEGPTQQQTLDQIMRLAEDILWKET